MGTDGPPVVVGRGPELDALVAQLAGARLVTLVGPGGIGKSTLASAAAARLAERGLPTRGVDLAGTTDATSVGAAVAAAFGAASLEALAGGTIDELGLLVLESCEHVLDDVADALAGVARAAPSTTVLATSRSPLGLRDEVVVPVGPLAVPAPGVPDPEVAAVALFLHLATRAGGLVGDEDVEDVCELCRRVDGVPLAIEILATRTRAASPGEILDDLGDRLHAASRGGFRRSGRQRSVRDAIEWSHRLLSVPAQDLFDRLGAFAGPFTARAAHAVAADPGAAPADTVDLLATLVDTSLLVAERRAATTTWYRQLRPVRACARDHLEERGELVATTERLVAHLLAEGHDLAATARTGFTVEVVARMAAQQDSFLHALRWSLDHDEDPARALWLLAVLWGHQLQTDEVRALGEAALDRWPDPSAPGWADAAVTVATCRFLVGRFDEASALADQALAAVDTATYAPVTARRLQGQLRRSAGDPDGALAAITAGAEEARARGFAAWAAELDLHRAEVLADLGRIDDALAVVRARRAETAGAPGEFEWIYACATEGLVLLRVDPTAAAEVSTRAAEAARRGGYWAAAVVGHRLAGLARALDDDLPGAADALLEAVRLVVERRALGHVRATLHTVAVVLERAGSEGWEDLATTARAWPAVAVFADVPEAVAPLPPAEGRVLSLLEATEAATLDLRALRGADPAPTGPTTGPDTPDGPLAAHRFLRRGDVWEVAYAGSSTTVRHTKGMGDLARLLAAPHAEVAAVDLIGAAVVAPDTGEVVDATARRRYEDRIRELQEAVDEAEQHHDLARAERASAELDALVEHLSASLGLGDRARREGGDAERARTAVTRRIRHAIGRLDDLHPPLARHLRASITTGTYCAYRPEAEVPWAVADPEGAVTTSPTT